MKKITKFVVIILILMIISNVFLMLICKNESNAKTVSTNIESIDEKKYPGIKERIQLLKNKYPKWNFKIYYTEIDWNDAISNEYTGHGTSPKNLVQKGTNYKGEWICPICKDTHYDNGTWRCASKKAIEYMMDVRNSLNVSDIFQFEELTNPGCDLNTIKALVKGSFLEGHEQGLLDAAKNNNVNAYYIAARLLQEQGKEGTVLVKGTGYNNKYVGFYNAFNIAASGNTTEEILTNALAYAEVKGWNSLDSSINGGISFIANQYIKKNQNTLYFQKFNTVGTDNKLYTNQYQQNILAAQNEGTTLRNVYINSSTLESDHTFIIPVYENMPETVCPRPSTTEEIKTDGEYVRVNVNETIRLRNTPNGNTTVGWLYKDEIVIRTEKATSKVNGTYWDKVKKENGTEGYVARETYENESEYKLYLVPINNDSNNNDNNNNNNNNNGDNSNGKDDPVSNEKVKVNKEENIITVIPDATAQDILDVFGTSTKITRANNSLLNGPSELMGTGYKVLDKYTVIKLGDVNGDGKANSLDALNILKYCVGTEKIEGIYLKAADVDKNTKTNSGDALNILKYNVGNIKIEL